MVTREGFWGLGESRCHSCLQEGGSEELQAGQPHLTPWGSDGAINPGSQTRWRTRKWLGV